MSRVGVHVTTSAQAGRSNTGVASGRLITAGLAQMGPAGVPTIIRSVAGFNAVFGGRTPYNGAIYDTLRTFFEEGGGEVVFIRVTGPAAKTGSVELSSASGSESLTLTANSPGAWSGDVQVKVDEVEATAFAPQRTRITITNPNGTTDVFTKDTADALAQDINARSQFVTATLGSADAAVPAAGDAVKLSAGDDDRSAVGVTEIADALDTAGSDWGTGAVALPGIPADAAGERLLNHAQKFSRVALMAMDEDATVADVEAAAAALSQHPAADYGAIIYPWLVVPDGSASRTCPPEGYAAAERAAAHVKVGPWRAPAGDFSTARWVLGTNELVDQITNEGLVDANVTGITTGNNKTRLYGWWSLSTNSEHFEMLTSRDTLNYLTYACQQALEEFVFDTIDGRGLLTGKVESALVGVLDPIARANGFYPLSDAQGNEIDPGYQVSVDDTINTQQTRAENKVLGRVAVRLSPTATLIELEIVKAPFAGAI